MMNKTMVELWMKALSQLHCSLPHVMSIKDKVYQHLRLSYNSLLNMILQWCFLFSSLYPENCSIKSSELIKSWIADGITYKHQNLEKSFNYGIVFVENLEDCCLLEQGEDIGTIKMHDLVRDLAIWISLLIWYCIISNVIEVAEIFQEDFIYEQQT